MIQNWFISVLILPAWPSYPDLCYSLEALPFRGPTRPKRTPSIASNRKLQRQHPLLIRHIRNYYYNKSKYYQVIQPLGDGIGVFPVVLRLGRHLLGGVENGNNRKIRNKNRQKKWTKNYHDDGVNLPKTRWSRLCFSSKGVNLLKTEKKFGPEPKKIGPSLLDVSTRKWSRPKHAAWTWLVGKLSRQREAADSKPKRERKTNSRSAGRVISKKKPKFTPKLGQICKQSTSVAFWWCVTFIGKEIFH